MVRLTLLLILLSPFSHRQTHMVEWSAERKLNWSDFLGDPDQNDENAALTCSNINFRFGYGSAGFNYTISCRFDKKKSWGRIKTDYVLAHEQGHFDIAEIYARKLNKALREYRYNERTVSRDVNAIYGQLMDEHSKVQNKYDLETDHSLKKPEQTEWFTRISGELRSYQRYANYAK